MQIGYVIYIFTSVFIQIYFLDTYYKFTYFLREKETGDEIKYLDSSSSEDELYSNENHDLDNNENSINDLETILEE